MTTGTKAKIVVIDDDQDCAALFASHLARHGYSVDMAFDGQQAWNRVLERPPDLITLDYMMPNRTGLRFFRDLRSDRNLQHIPIVLITGITMGGTKSKNIFSSSLRWGAPEGHLEKPVSAERLVELINGLLSTRSAS
ncbi:MAG: response regulator [Acidobacteriota bacterium]